MAKKLYGATNVPEKKRLKGRWKEERAMDSTRDPKGRFLKGNVAARKSAGKAREGGFLSGRAKKSIERELEELKQDLEKDIGSPSPREKTLIEQLISQRRMLIYIDSCIKKFEMIDLKVIDLQLKAMEAERKTHESLKAGHVEKFKTPLEKIAEIEAREAEEAEEAKADDPDGGEHRIL